MMIISQLLLAIFLGYWLFSQFTYNKKLLTEELERGLRNSEKQVIDSLLATNLINPYLNDTSNFSVIMIDPSQNQPNKIKFKHGIHTDTDSLVMSQSSGYIENKLRYPQKQEITIAIDDSLFSPDSKSVTIRSITDTNLLFQSAQLFIRTVGVFTESEDSMSSFLYSNIDTLLLKELFKDYTEEKELDIEIEWITNNDSVIIGSSVPDIFLNSQLVKNSYGVNIYEYQFFLVKLIAPEIIFAILLLLITSIAFRMAYLSIKNQRKLMIIKNDFISNISHELKTPVSTVKVALEALLEFDMKKDPKLTEDYLKMAHSEMNRLDLLVNKVLKNSALENGSQFIFPEKVNLNSIVTDVLNSMKSRCDQFGAEVDFGPSSDANYIDADSLHLHGVIVNLIDNSLKYTIGKPKISITISQNNKGTNLNIFDNGIGIPNEYIDKVFEKFFRVPNKDKHNVKGYGLGLNYAALVMKHHNGSISVKNIDTGGCNFTLHFPKLEL